MTAMDKQSVDPALWPLVEGFPPIDVSAETLAGFRAAFVGMSVMPDPATHADVRIERVSVPGLDASAPAIPCLLFTPVGEAARGALLHIHGGGFVMGTTEMDAPRNLALVRATGAAILSVEYRLAPEHPCPAGLEDCHAALAWLAAQATRIGFSGQRIGVIGESSGGGLAAALAMLARDRRSVALACQALIYPMLVPPGQSCAATDADARTGRHIWTRASNAYCWSAYLSSARSEGALVAGAVRELANLPPAFLAVGDLDLFVHDNLQFVGRLLAAGNAVEAHLYPGAIHGFDRAVDAEVSQRYTRELVRFLRQHLG